MIEKCVEQVRLFEFLYGQVEFYDTTLKEKLIDYINRYVRQKKLDERVLEKQYRHFLQRYAEDVGHFKKSGKYPAISGVIGAEISADCYNIALLLSTIMSQHRYDIMHEIDKAAEVSSKALIVGCGIGLELMLISGRYKQLDAYDLSLDKFCENSNSKVRFFEKEFVESKTKKYDDIYIIELLEHLHNPYVLLASAAGSLGLNGRIITTLAVDMPQFDHVFNFNDVESFNRNVKELGLSIVYSKDVHHTGKMNGLPSSKNIFLILERA